MGKHIVNPSDIKTRAYKLLLYPDNPDHMRVLRLIKRHTEYSKVYIGIWHTLHDEAGNEILSGSGKKHAHLIVNHKNPVWWESFCNSIGIETRFCMPISVNMDKSGKFVKDGRSSLERGYCYLIHLNTPDKEQYSCDELWGSEEMKENAVKAVDAYLSRNISMSACVYMALDWIRSQNHYVSYTEFTEWLCGTPYFKCQSSPMVRAVLDEHNRKYMREAQRNAEQFRSSEAFEQMTGVPRFGIVGSSCRVYRFDEFQDIEELSGDDESNGGVIV